MSQDTLSQLSALCQQLARSQRESVEAAAALKRKLEAMRRLEEDDIPSLMTELGVTEIVLETGEKITVALEVYAEFSKSESETKAKAFAWLEANGHGGLIKTDVSVQFGREELPKATALSEKLAEEGFMPELSRNIHAQTLKAFIKEQLIAGEPVPLDMFGARSVQKAKVKGGSI